MEQHLIGQGLEVANISVTELHRHLYTSGIAHQLLTLATEHYDQSIALAYSLGLFDLAQDIKLRADKGKSYQREIEQLLQKTRIKATKSLAVANAPGLRVAPDTLQAAVHKSLSYLRHNRDAQGCWTDFMTSAGQSTLWVTAYTGLLLAETKQGVGAASEAFDASFSLPMSYNTGILQDGDSTTFAMGLRHKVWGETTRAQLANWLAFMDADGGWVTYRNEEALRKRLALPAAIGVHAWLTPKLSVTAAAAYVLKTCKELSEQYAASCAYLAAHQHPDGYWLSYWWTSPIYATSFALLALVAAPAHTACYELGIAWLASQQAESGAWLDATSNEQPSAFFTALAVKALVADQSNRFFAAAAKGIRWLLAHQTTDGSWVATRILRIPATDVAVPALVREWRTSSFGVNTLIDDHNRIFTTGTALNALSMFAKASIGLPAYC